MISGFNQTYQFLLDHRPYLLAQVQDTAGLHVRYVFVRRSNTTNPKRRPGVTAEPGCPVTAVAATTRCSRTSPRNRSPSLKQLDIPASHQPLAAAICAVWRTVSYAPVLTALPSASSISHQKTWRDRNNIRLSWSLFRLSGALR